MKFQPDMTSRTKENWLQMFFIVWAHFMKRKLVYLRLFTLAHLSAPISDIHFLKIFSRFRGHRCYEKINLCILKGFYLWISRLFGIKGTLGILPRAFLRVLTTLMAARPGWWRLSSCEPCFWDQFFQGIHRAPYDPITLDPPPRDAIRCTELKKSCWGSILKIFVLSKIFSKIIF